jgi:dimethylaniline monooxygenase (N-oxide forming)
MQIIDDGQYINVVRGSIDSSSGYDVRLSNGTVVKCEVIVFATGWIPDSMSLFRESDRSIYGIPTRTDQLSDGTAAYWKDMDSMGDVEIRNIYPWLPKDVAEDADTTQYRLFRTIVPPELAAKNDRSLIFLGHCGNAQTPMFAEVSALWGIAYLEGLLETGSCEGRLGNLDGMNEDVAIVNAYMRKRYRGKGKFSIPIAPTEIQTFVDKLVSDLGLRTDRKVKNSSNRGWFGIKAWIEEWFTPYLPVDYRGIIDEFLALKEGEMKKTGGGIGST